MAKNKEATTIQLNGKTVSLTGGPVGVYRSPGSIAFDVLNYLIIGLAAFTTVMPIIYIICNSFATELELRTSTSSRPTSCCAPSETLCSSPSAARRSTCSARSLWPTR